MSAEPRENPESASETEITEMPEQARDAIKDSDENAKILMQTKISRRWSAPLPPPQVLERYSSSVQAEIVDEMKNESAHRRALQVKSLDAEIAAQQKSLGAEIERDHRGQIYTFVLVIVVVITSAALMWVGRTWGLALLIVGIVAALNPFLEKLRELFSSDKKENRNEHSD